MKTQILIVGGGTGGVAAALGACAMGMRVVLTEETDWLGGQLTSQAVPPDENPWIETQGCTTRYRRFRERVRQEYRDCAALNSAALNNPLLNPGGGYVSRLCFTPLTGRVVLEGMLGLDVFNGRLTILLNHKPVAVETNGDRIVSVTLRETTHGKDQTIEADYVLDATELGDLLLLADVESVTGAESRRETAEPRAVDGPAEPRNVQAFTWCFALAYDRRPGANHTIEKPRQYDFWRNFKPQLLPPYTGRLIDWIIPNPSTLSGKRCELFKTADDTIPLFPYRQIVSRDRFENSNIDDVTIVNWPQNDYFLKTIDQPGALDEAKQLSLSLLYWLQTEQGYPMLYLMPDILGTPDGFAKYPYIRESRRIRAVFTVTENHVGTQTRHGEDPPDNPTGFSRLAEPFHDTIGVGYYRIDLHPSTGGDNSIDLASLPFQIPLGALLPLRMQNLLPACKNIGTTHITNGCYRLHPVEWNIGEAAGLLAAHCLARNLTPHQVRQNKSLLDEFQQLLANQGVQLHWNRSSF